MARTGVPAGAAIPMPCHGRRVLFGPVAVPNWYTMRPCTGPSSRPPAAANTPADPGQLAGPVQGRIVFQFGTATGPNNTRIPWHGIGIAAPAGTPVRAIAGGSVSLAGPLGTYLTSVLVDHGGGYYSFYGSLNDATVIHGERVTKGQILGHVGGGSSDQGPHLHFEIRGQGGIALDPVNWLKTRR